MIYLDPNKEWFYTRAGNRFGPVAASQLQAFAQSGDLDAQADYVWCRGMSDWVPAHQVDGLFAPAAGAAPGFEPAFAAPAIAAANSPYAAPRTEAVYENDNSGYLGEPQAVPAGNVSRWIGGAWGIFKAQAGLWIGVFLTFFMISFVVSLIPLVGSIISPFLNMVLLGGIMYACEMQRQNGSFAFGDIFAGFQNNVGQLLLAALIYFLVVFGVLFVLLFGLGMSSALAGGSGSEEQIQQMFTGPLGMIVLLVGMVFLTLVMAAIYLVPALIMLQNETAINAIKLSFKAFTRNIGGAFLCSLACVALYILGIITLLLGLLVAVPMVLIVPYCVYRDVFFES